MRVTTRGQVTFPADIRMRLGMLPGTEVEFTIVDQGVVITTLRSDARRVRRMATHLRGRGTVQMTTDEILALTRAGEARKANLP